MKLRPIGLLLVYPRPTKDSPIKLAPLSILYPALHFKAAWRAGRTGFGPADSGLDAAALIDWWPKALKLDIALGVGRAYGAEQQEQGEPNRDRDLPNHDSSSIGEPDPAAPRVLDGVTNE